MEFLLRLAFDLLFRILFSLPGWIAAHGFRLHGSVHAEGLSLADSPHLSSNRTRAERPWRPFRPNANGEPERISVLARGRGGRAKLLLSRIPVAP